MDNTPRKGQNMPKLLEHKMDVSLLIVSLIVRYEVFSGGEQTNHE